MLYLSIALILVAVLAWDFGRRLLASTRKQDSDAVRRLIEDRFRESIGSAQHFAADVNDSMRRAIATEAAALRAETETLRAQHLQSEGNILTQIERLKPSDSRAGLPDTLIQTLHELQEQLDTTDAAVAQLAREWKQAFTDVEGRWKTTEEKLQGKVAGVVAGMRSAGFNR